MTIPEAIRHERSDWHIPPHRINKGECMAFAQSIVRVVEDTKIIGDERLTFGGETISRHVGSVGHVWITDGVLHYDAQCPDGVEDWRDLPFMRD